MSSNRYPKCGKVTVNGEEYEYTICKLSEKEYRVRVPKCREACRIVSYEVEEYHIKTYIEQSFWQP